MAGLRRMLAALALGSAMISRPAVAQHGSVSLTHMVTVTVPPRVKVQVAPAAPVAQTGVNIARSQASSDGLSLTVSATQPWSLSIGSVAKKSRLQWSLDRRSGFAAATTRTATIASGTLSQIPTAATVFFRDTGTAGSPARDGALNASDAILITVAAQ